MPDNRNLETTAAFLLRRTDDIMSVHDWLSPGFEIVSQRATRAIKSYARDRLRQGQSLAVSWAVAVGMFAIAFVFVLGIVIVGLIALFSFLRFHFGIFESYGLIAGLLFLLVLLSSGIAIWLLRRPTPHFPSLTSRLRVATHAPRPARTSGNARASTIQIPARSALLFAAAAIVLTVAAIGRR